MVIGRFNLGWDWEAIALPLCVARGWGGTIIRIGPIFFCWEHELRKPVRGA